MEGVDRSREERVSSAIESSSYALASASRPEEAAAHATTWVREILPETSPCRSPDWMRQAGSARCGATERTPPRAMDSRPPAASLCRRERIHTSTSRRSRAGGERRSSRSSGASSPWAPRDPGGSSITRRAIRHVGSHRLPAGRCGRCPRRARRFGAAGGNLGRARRHRTCRPARGPEEALAIAASALSRDVRAPVAIWWSPDDGVRALASLSGVNAAKTDVVVRDLGEVAPSDQMSDGERAELRQRFARVLGVRGRDDP